MRKKSIKKAAEAFEKDVEAMKEYLDAICEIDLSDEEVTWCHDYAIIRLYRVFEGFILSSLVASINNDTKQLAASTGVEFPKHLTDEVCEYIIVKDGYFEFRGRDGLIKTAKRYLPETHFIVTHIKKATYKDALERLSGLRNFAAHESPTSKRAALKAIGAKRLSASGAWLKKQERFKKLADKLCVLTKDIATSAPY